MQAWSNLHLGNHMAKGYTHVHACRIRPDPALYMKDRPLARYGDMYPIII